MARADWKVRRREVAQSVSMSESLQRAQFRSQMVMVRHFVDGATPDDAEFFYRELMREVKKLAATFRLGNQFVIAESSQRVVVSAPERVRS